MKEFPSDQQHELLWEENILCSFSVFLKLLFLPFKRNFCCCYKKGLSLLYCCKRALIYKSIVIVSCLWAKLWKCYNLHLQVPLGIFHHKFDAFFTQTFVVFSKEKKLSKCFNFWSPFSSFSIMRKLFYYSFFVCALTHFLCCSIRYWKWWRYELEEKKKGNDNQWGAIRVDKKCKTFWIDCTHSTKLNLESFVGKKREERYQFKLFISDLFIEFPSMVVYIEMLWNWYSSFDFFGGVDKFI